jgi:hypothetical protein
MLRIHFTAEDIARTTLLAEPDPLWEILLSLHMLQVEDGPIPYGAWRQRLRRRLPRELVSRLTALAPPVGYSPDFLTPTTESHEFGKALDLMLSAPRRRIQAELSMLSVRPAAAIWVRQLADATPEAMRTLGHSMRVYHRWALQAYWPSLKAAVHADYRRRCRDLAAGGVGAALAATHPQARWHEQVLELDILPDEDVWLNGRGLQLQPSYFCWRQPTKLMDPELPPVLVFPIQGATGLTRGTDPGDSTAVSVAALLGRTRAEVLARTATGATTTQVAVACNISLPTASHQTMVLRAAGLIVSGRHGRSVVHHASALGLALLNGSMTWPADTEDEWRPERTTQHRVAAHRPAH